MTQSIDDLPDDVLDDVFTFLCFQDLLVTELVSKKWREISFRRWRTFKAVSLSELLNVKPASNCEIEYYQKYNRQTTPKITDVALRFLAKRCGKNLRELVSGCRLKMDLNCFSTLASDFPRLQLLDLSKMMPVSSEEFDGWPDLATGSAFDELRTSRMDASFDDSGLAYHDNFDSVDPLLFKFFSTMPLVETVSLAQNTLLNGSSLLGLSSTVQSLDLGLCRRITADMLILVFSNLTNLVHVSLYSNNRLTGVCLSYLHANLESIDLSYCDSLDADSLVEFFETHTRLKNVQLAHVRGLTSGVLISMSDCLRDLEILNLSCYHRTSYYENYQHPHDIGQGSKALAGLKFLKQLDLSENQFVSDTALIGISYGCSNLEDLNVSQLNDVTALGFASLGRLGQLRKLDISGNDCVDETVLLSAAQGGNLEFVNARNCEKINEAALKNLSNFWPNKTTVFQVY